MSEDVMLASDHAMAELVLQRDYLIGLIIEQEIPERTKKEARRRRRRALLEESTIVDPNTSRVREIGKY